MIGIVLVGVLLAPQPYLCARTTAEGECHLVGVKQTDMVGKTSAYPDDQPDVVFSLNLKAPESAPAIAVIEIQTVAGSRGSWSSLAKARGAGFMGVARAKDPSILLNREGGRLNLKPQEDRNLLLFVTDDGKFSEKNRKYRVRVVHTDGASFTVPVNVEAASPEARAASPLADFPVRMTGVLRGISRYDAVNAGKTIAGDDKADGLFVLNVEAKDKEISGIEIRNTDGIRSVWDTVPSSRNGAIGVASVSEPVKLLNRRDGSVSIPVDGRVDLNLYVADNGSIAGGKTNYRIAVTFSDGEISWCPVAAAEEGPQPAATRRTTSASKVNFLGSWLGFVSTDAVGPYPGLKPDGKADAVFGLDIEVKPKGYITGIEVNSVLGGDRKWGTAGTSSGTWGLGVAYQTAPTALLNKQDGSVRIPIDGRVQFYLYAADPGDLKTTHQGLRIIVHLADGSSYQQLIKRPSGTTPSVVPDIDETGRPKGVITCEFRGFIADLVNTSTRPGKDGYLDGTFIMKLEVEDKKLVKVEISGGDGVTRWSSDAKPPVMFLGVALYPKIYILVNDKTGRMNVPLSGRRTLYLYAADNGMLSDPKAVLRVTATFSDKTTLSTPVIK